MTEQIKKLSPEDGKSLDIEAQNIEQLKLLFPDVFREGKVDFEALKAVLGEHVEDNEERYNFTWHGKNKARQIAQTPSTGTLRPCKKESVNWDSTQNIFIEGDNLEVLKLLQKSYHQKVKMIYIDPPYNTGKDFVYKDNFNNNITNYFQLTGQVDFEGNKHSVNSDSSGRYHTDWLNMMYPRLKLARNLLRSDGAVFISINDCEIDNLKRIGNEIFGEDNFVAQIIWQKSKRGDSKLIGVTHEYVVVYTKNKQAAIESGIWRKKKDGVDEVLAKYESFKAKFNSDHMKVRAAMQEWYKSLKSDDPKKSHKHYSWSDDRGLYFPDNFAGPDDGRKSRPRHDILHPITNAVCKKPSTGWRWDEKKTNWALKEEPPRIHFGDDETTIPNRKSYLKETSLEPFSSVIYADGRSATLEVEKYVGKSIFQFPKNKEVLAKFIDLLCKEDDVILDFFAGSGSTGHAIFDLSKNLNQNLNFILVQLPELVDAGSKAFEAGYKKISDITLKRLRGASDEYLSEQGTTCKLDFGFKVFKLDYTNINQWEGSFDNLSDILDNSVDSIKSERTSEDVLYEVLLKYGLDLTYPITEHSIAGKTVYDVAFGSLIVCLDDDISRDVVEGIGKLKQELDSETTRVVFKDAGFADDSVKVNAIQMLKQYGVDDVKSI